MILDDLQKIPDVTMPDWLPANTFYLTITGSEAYGTSVDVISDKDFTGFCIPPKQYIFPHTAGYLYGFDEFPKFNEWIQHNIQANDKEYDVTVYSIIKFFQMALSGNPNIIASLYTPRDCVVHSTQVAELVRDNRRLFLSKLCYEKFRGFAYSQLCQAEGHGRSGEGKRKPLIDKFGYDTKFASNVIRLIREGEQVLRDGHLDLRRHRDEIKAVRNGAMTLVEVRKFFTENEPVLEELYRKTKLPAKPPREEIRQLLLKCLEVQYGSLDKMIANSTADAKLRQIRDIIQ